MNKKGTPAIFIYEYDLLISTLRYGQIERERYVLMDYSTRYSLNRRL